DAIVEQDFCAFDVGCHGHPGRAPCEHLQVGFDLGATLAGDLVASLFQVGFESAQCMCIAADLDADLCDVVFDSVVRQQLIGTLEFDERQAIFCVGVQLQAALEVAGRPLHVFLTGGGFGLGFAGAGCVGGHVDGIGILGGGWVCPAECSGEACPAKGTASCRHHSCPAKGLSESRLRG